MLPLNYSHMGRIKDSRNYVLTLLFSIHLNYKYKFRHSSFDFQLPVWESVKIIFSCLERGTKKCILHFSVHMLMNKLWCSHHPSLSQEDHCQITQKGSFDSERPSNSSRQGSGITCI